MDQDRLLQSFDEIVQGYTEAKYRKRTVYIKHFSLRDHADFDRVYEEHFARAQKRKIHTEKEKLKFCIEQNLWSEQRERDITVLKKTIESLEAGKKRIILPSQLESTITRIKNEKIKLNKMLSERQNVLGFTCEVFASEKLNNYCIFKAFHSDSELSNRLFSKEEYEELEKYELNELTIIYNLHSQNYSDLRIKKIAVSNFFQNYFSLCDENIYVFFCKPIVNLSLYQVRMVSYGRYFKSLLSSNTNIPPDIAQDPEKLVDFIEMSRNREKRMKTNKNDNIGLVGATKEDMQALKGDYEIDDTHEKAKASGKKTLNMRDLLELQKKK